MATYSQEKLTRTVIRYTVPASRPWGANEQDIFMAFQAAKNQHAEIEKENPTVSMVRFLPSDEDIIIEFDYEQRA